MLRDIIDSNYWPAEPKSHSFAEMAALRADAIPPKPMLASEEACSLRTPPSVGRLSSARTTYVGEDAVTVLRAMFSSPGRDFILSWNWALAIIHGFAACVFAVWFLNIFSDSASRPFRGSELIPSYLYDHRDGGDVPLFRVSERMLAILVVAYFVITMIAHLFYAVNENGTYLKLVGDGKMFGRWIEFAITATIMVAVVATVCGVRDSNAYFGLLVANASIMATGYWWEMTRSPVALVVGFGLLAWIYTTIIRSFIDRVRDARAKKQHVPSFVYAILITILAFFGCFGLVPVAQYAFGDAYTPYAVESTYIALSLAAKLTLGSLLAWGIGGRVNVVKLERSAV